MGASKKVESEPTETKPKKKRASKKKKEEIVENETKPKKKRVSKKNTSKKSVNSSESSVTSVPVKNVTTKVKGSKKSSKSSVKDSNEYDIKFNELKEKYVAICKETYELQLQLNEKDKERECLLQEIRKLQNVNFPDLNYGNVLGKELISNNDDTVKLSIKKPLRATDMETDDSESKDDFL